MLTVQAAKRGYYKGLREPGDVFQVKDAGELGSWMEKVDGKPDEQSVQAIEPRPPAPRTPHARKG